jgi:polyhydroxybutyrate depolymerase
MAHKKPSLGFAVLAVAGIILAVVSWLFYRHNPAMALARGAGYVLFLWLLTATGILLASASAFFWIKRSRGWRWARNYLFIVAGLAVIAVAFFLISNYLEHRQYHYISVDGVRRQYLIQVPSGYSPGHKVPLLLGLHGGTGNARQFENDSGFNRVAEKEGFIVVYPDGLGKFKYTLHVWNSGYIQAAGRAGTDDVTFIKDLVDYLKSQYSIDDQRVYITGHSNGGMMTDRMASEYPEIFAAAAPVSSAIGGKATPASPLYTIPQPAQPVSMVRVHGYLDQNVLYDGGFSRGGFGLRARYDISEKVSTAFWVKNNGCQTIPETENSAGGLISLEKYSGGRNKSEVVLVTFKNADHSWDNLNRTVPAEHFHGSSLAEMIWNLLKGYSRGN